MLHSTPVDGFLFRNTRSDNFPSDDHCGDGWWYLFLSAIKGAGDSQMTKRFSLGRLLCLVNNGVIVCPPSSLVDQRSWHILLSDIRCQLYKTSFRLQSNQTAFNLCSQCPEVSVKDVRWMLSPPLDQSEHYKYKYNFVFQQFHTNWELPGIILWLIRSLQRVTWPFPQVAISVSLVCLSVFVSCGRS